MSKFGSPFNTNELFLTQTYHGENAYSPGDLSKQCAIDLGKIASSYVLSVCEGTVELVTASMGGYISIIPDDAEFRILYVHVDRFEVSKGQRVTKGQIIGRIKHLVTGSHLHFGLKNISGLAPHPQPMDYFDRGLVFKTNYSDIRTVWFNGQNLNWSLFRDLSYNSNNMKIGDNVEFSADTNLRVGSFIPKPDPNSNIKLVIKKGAVGNVIGGPRTADGYQWWDVRFLNDQGWVANPGGVRLVKTTRGVTQTDGGVPEVPDVPPVVDPTLELLERIDILTKENAGLRMALGDCEDKNDLLSALKDGLVADLDEILKKYDNLHIEKNRIENERNEWQLKHDKLKQQLEESKENFITVIVEWVKEMLTKVLGDRS